MSGRVFDTVLVANRGEIAVRVMRTLRALGIRSVAVFSDADAGARHVTEADEAVRIGPAPAAESYLHAERVLEAAAATGAEAVHPGYGFLAENAAFARACAGAGFVFIGPPPEAIETMGDKIRARETVTAAGVPVVPGVSGAGLDDDALVAAALEVGFPVLLKPAAGGGGKGMRLVHDAASLADDVAAARREARAAFGDDTLLFERFVARPRHVEVQVFADHHGNVVHLGERECSLQRRHQKIVEEAPSPRVGTELREAMGATAVEAARACGYVNAGTVEFLLSDEASGETSEPPDRYFFIEMNTRLQVEHPVTEMVYGVDLVELQLRVAAGEALPFAQREVERRGHAIEARVYAEDPSRGFLPTGGRVLGLREPRSEGVRMDSGLATGDVVGSSYDPMLAKVVAWAPDRAEALHRLDRALADTVVLGVTTNVGFLRTLLALPAVREGRLHTGLVEQEDERLAPRPVPDDVLVAAALARLVASEPLGREADPWDVPGGWRLGDAAWTPWHAASGARSAELRVQGRAGGARVVVDGGEPLAARARAVDDELVVDLDGRTLRYVFAREARTLWLGRDGDAWAVTLEGRADAGAREETMHSGGPVVSPMPGTVVAVQVAEGDEVVAGQALVVVEAMKMEHTLVAPVDGLVTAVHAASGQQVVMDQPLVTVEARGA